MSLLSSILGLEGKGVQASKVIEIVNVLKSRLDEYIQQKEDFLAEITTQPLVMTKTVRLYQDVILKFVTNTLIIDNLASNEGLRYKDLKNPPIVLHFCSDGKKETRAIFKCAEGCQYEYPFCYPYTGYCSKYYNEDDHDGFLGIVEVCGGDVSIEVPGPLGEYALFGIFENLIRNIAKHNQVKDKIEIYLKVSEPEDDDEKRYFYELKIWDNVTDPCKSVNRRAPVEGEETETLKNLLEYFIKSSIINDSGKLIPQAWGIAEMKICATLLRGSTDFTKISEYLELSSERIDGKNRLVYKLYLMKPQRLLFLPKNNALLNEKESLQERGIWIFKEKEELSKHVKGGTENPAVSPAIFVNETCEDLSKLEPYLPFRRIDSTVIDPKSNDPESLLHKAYGTWIQEKLFKKEENKKKIVVIIYTNEDRFDGIWERWIDKLSDFNDRNEEFKVFLMDKNGNLLPNSKNNILNNCKIALWDRHGGGYNRLNSGKNNIFFLCEFDKLSPDFGIIYTADPPLELFYNLVEASLIKILVIDERCSERISDEIGDRKFQSVYGGINRFMVGCKAGIYIASHINNQPLHPSLKEKYLNIVIDESNHVKINCKGSNKAESLCNFNVVIIHQGILDELGKFNASLNPDKFIKGLKGKGRWVVIESGRGIPPQLQEGPLSKEKFLPFSLLEHFVLGPKLAKILLTQVILKLTRRRM